MYLVVLAQSFIAGVLGNLLYDYMPQFPLLKNLDNNLCPAHVLGVIFKIKRQAGCETIGDLKCHTNGRGFLS